MNLKEISSELHKGLATVDMDPESIDSGLYFVSGIRHEKLPIPIIISLEKASSVDADAVYFRSFPDDRSPIPQIYLYDFTVNDPSPQQEAEIHRKVWSLAEVQLFYIFTKTQIKIFNSAKPVDLKGADISTSPLEIIDIASKADNHFSAKLFDNGTFWEESSYRDKFSLNSTVQEKLIYQLKNVRNEYLKKSGLPPKVSKRLIVLGILVKYLEERRDYKTGQPVFPNDYFKKFNDADSFADVLREGLAVELFDELSDQFNGKIFKWSIKSERKLIRNTDLNLLADFLDANLELETGQYVIWRLYSFNHLPVELISSIYEEFLKEEPGIVYTPSYLVDYLVDKCMPLESPKEDFKILDPACGSGIFLVGAFKRLVEWWRIIEFNKTEIWRKPTEEDLPKLLNILKDNIFGIDKNSEAADLTIFSLSLALCDFFSPPVIWKQLTLPNLKDSNISAKSYFEWYQYNKKKKFDLIIGNPPYQEKLTDKYANILEENRTKILNLPSLPQNQIALLFLEVSTWLLKEDADLCLLISSSSILYNNTKKAANYRKYFFKNFNIKQIVDFSCLSDILFNKSSVSVSAFFLVNNQDNNSKINHLTVRRFKATKEKFYFEFDNYDFHSVSIEQAINEPHIWKCNLMGGGRISDLVSRLQSLRTFGEYIEKNANSNGWKYGEGFILGTDTENLSELVDKGKLKKANYITGKLSLPT
ncbi:MAG: N-6 DNA methylase, partial [Candidatus Marinimicrobia bacterium]|nr:N-6 DNA methylase [Candidatus Neomarinimicrobiota bacterium]